MTVLHMLEHAWAVLGIIALLALAWFWKEWRWHRMSETERHAMTDHYQSKQPGWWTKEGK